MTYNDENENEKKNEQIIFCIMMFSFLIATGQFLIDNSNVLRLNNLETYGEVATGEIISNKSSYDQIALSVVFNVNNNEYKRRILLDESAVPESNKVSLHYLKGNPENAVYLKCLKKNLTENILSDGS